MELKDKLGVTYKCAWRIGHEIRKYMADVDGDGMLDGHVELDEAYVGGRKRGGKKHGLTGRGADKAIVFGMVERDGEVITRVVETASRRDMLPHVLRHVEPGTHISTDEYMPYRALPKMGYSHGDGPTPGEAVCKRAGSRQQHRGFLADPEAVDPGDARLGFEEASVEIPWRV